MRKDNSEIELKDLKTPKGEYSFSLLAKSILSLRP